jgi:S-adenosylmethionine-diacylgycerolhomoserine-N-methlytransferase
MTPAGRAMDAGVHMDSIYRHQRHIYDLTRKYYLLGRDALIRELAPAPGESVLEVGCGTGRNLICAARRYPQARFFGLDVSPAMLATAHANIARAGLSGRITLAEADATNFNAKGLFGEAGFDRIFLSYTLSMIPDWRTALAHAARQLNPGGRLDLVDFGQQERLPTGFRALLFAWLAKFDVSPRAELRRTAETIAADEQLAALWQSKLRGYAWSAQLLRN